MLFARLIQKSWVRVEIKVWLANLIKYRTVQRVKRLVIACQWRENRVVYGQWKQIKERGKVGNRLVFLARSKKQVPNLWCALMPDR